MSNNAKLKKALDLLREVEKDWNEDNVVCYTPSLPSFDEVVSELSNIVFHDGKIYADEETGYTYFLIDGDLAAAPSLTTGGFDGENYGYVSDFAEPLTQEKIDAIMKELGHPVELPKEGVTIGIVLGWWKAAVKVGDFSRPVFFDKAEELFDASVGNTGGGCMVAVVVVAPHVIASFNEESFSVSTSLKGASGWDIFNAESEEKVESEFYWASELES